MALSFEYKFLKWGYGKNNGPTKWPEMFPVPSGGKRQSPIDIIPGEVEQDASVAPLRAEYQPSALLNLENTGVSWHTLYLYRYW